MLKYLIKNTRYWIMLTLALFFICISIILSTGDHIDAWFYNKHFYESLLKEMAFALFIALAISIGVEESARREFNKHIIDKMKGIQKNVFEAVIGRDLPLNVFDEVKSLVLNIDFMRNDHKCIYKFLCQETEGERKTILLAKIAVSYTLRNITNAPKDAHICFHHSVPTDSCSLGLARVERLSIGDKTFSDDEISTFKKYRHGLADFHEYDYVVSDVPPQNEISVILEYTMEKELNDTEVLKSLFVSSGLHLVISFPKNCKFMHGIDGISRKLPKLLYAEEDKQYFEYMLSGPILPYQGLYFWWEKVE